MAGLLTMFLLQTSAVSEAQKLMSQAADLLPALHSTIQYGIQSQNDTTKGGILHTRTTAPTAHTFESHSYCSTFLSLSLSLPDHPIMMGFEPLVNQRLLPPTFPRYAKIIKREEMVNYFTKLIERIKTVCDVINISNLHSILVMKLFRNF